MALDIDKYRKNLFEISKRVEVINEHLKKVRATKYRITEVEFLCLQFRKILELIALSSLVANKKEYSKQHSKFAQHYNPRLIFKDLERINPNFYPKPTEQKLIEVNGERFFNLENIESGYLTKEDFLEAYKICGGMMHAQNPYSVAKDIDRIEALFPRWLTKIVVLLNHHIITMMDSTMVIGLMKGEDGLPHAFEFVQTGNLD